MKVCVILPALNEADNIAAVIEKIKRLNYDVVVVDDGSTDETSAIAKGCGAFVIRHNKRCGKGVSIKDGFEYAKGLGCEVLVTIDSDGQHDPDEIPLFLRLYNYLNVLIVSLFTVLGFIVNPCRRGLKNKGCK